MKKSLMLIASVAVLTAACGGSAATTTSQAPTDTTTVTTTPPDDDDAQGLVLRVGYTGGFIGPDFFVNQPPAYELYADGTLVFEGFAPAIFPGPAIKPLQSANIGDNLLGVMDLIEDAGLPDIDEEFDNDGANNVADASNTVFQYRDAAGVDHVLSVYALGFEQPPQGRDAILIQLTDFLAQLAAADDTTEYSSDRIQIFMRESDPAQDPTSEVVPWTLPMAPAQLAATAFQDWNCAVVEGDDAVTALDALRDATETTHFELDGTAYVAKARYLLPAETGCQPVFDF